MITDNLRVLLADHIESALVVQSFHWNVEGVDFKQYHDLFGSIYKELYEQVDTIAEFIRIVSDTKEYVNGSIDVIKLNKTINSKLVVGSNASSMVLEITKVSEELSKQLKEILDMCNKLGLDALGNYCVDRLDYHGKLGWMLKAICK